MDKEKDLVLYILMRNDLPSMNPGKAMAQAAHASNQFVGAGTSTDEDFENVADWSKQGKDFGTTMVLSITKQKLDSMLSYAEDKGFICGKVIDTSYPYTVTKEVAELIPVEIDTTERRTDSRGQNAYLCREEMTCAYIFGDRNDYDLHYLVRQYPLHN